MPPSRQDFDALILAAGFGTRLKPITNHTPKPVVPIFGIPAVVLIHDWLKRSGATRVGINTHYLPEKLTATLENWGVFFDRIYLEPEIRGTAGAFIAFEDWLSERPLLAHNSDIFHDIHVSQVAGFTDLLSQFKACLGVAIDLPNYPKKMSGIHSVINSIRGTPAPSPCDVEMGYLGIQMVTRAILPQIKKMDFPSDILASYIDAYSNGEKVGYRDLKPGVCFDIGSITEFLKIHLHILKNGTASFGIAGILAAKEKKYTWVGEGESAVVGKLTVYGPSYLSDVDCNKASGHIGPNLACWNSTLTGDFSGVTDCVIFESTLSHSDLPAQASNFVYSNDEFSAV